MGSVILKDKIVYALNDSLKKVDEYFNKTKLGNMDGIHLACYELGRANTLLQVLTEVFGDDELLKNSVTARNDRAVRVLHFPQRMRSVTIPVSNYLALVKKYYDARLVVCEEYNGSKLELRNEIDRLCEVVSVDGETIHHNGDWLLY